MADPYTTPMPPMPRQPDTRPLHRRKRVWLGGSGLFIAGALIAGAGTSGQQPVDARVEPATTITATATAAPKPGPTVTKTIKAEARPGPAVTATVTVTVTKTVTPKAANTNSGGQDSIGTCSIVSNSGNCYSAGQFCRNSDHGAVTTTVSGARITCTYSSNAWRWTYV